MILTITLIVAVILAVQLGFRITEDFLCTIVRTNLDGTDYFSQLF